MHGFRVDGSPDFTQQSLDFLTKKVVENIHPLVVSIVLDEMALHEHVDFDGKQFIGGTGNNYKMLM